MPGHWQGDPECKKPGGGLGKKNRGSPRKGPPRQVQIAEALEVQHVEHPEDAGHEALAVQHLPRSASLADVFAGGKDQQKEINVVDSSLARDKMLVGALDTACNRTCTGTSWLQSYLKCLDEAPTYVRKLVCRVNEHEVFRFGNGGTQVSYDRWRLPAVIDGTLVCFWTSLVAVPSLGLLLGRDFMDALGTVMHFSKRMVRFEMIGPSHLPLRQLAAGHFMLPLQPADASWPSAKPELRWRKLGVDGVVELQVGVKTWWHGKLACKGNEFSKVNEHMLTESSVSAGHAVCAVMTSSPALSDRDLSMKPRALVSGGLTSTSTSRTLPTSSTTSCLKSSTATDGPNQPVDTQDRHQKVFSGNMEKVRSQNDQEVRVARKRRPSLVGAKGLLALCALSLPLGVHMRSLDGSSKEDGPTAGLPFASSSRARHHHQGLQCSQPGRCDLAEEQTWNEGGFSGRSIAGWNDGCKDQQRNRPTGSSRSLRPSSRTSSHSFSSEQVGEGGQRVVGAKRWTTNFEERPDQVGGILGAAGGREGHSGPTQGRAPLFGASLVQRARRLKQQQSTTSSGCEISRKDSTSFFPSRPPAESAEVFTTQRIWDRSRALSNGVRRGANGCSVSGDGGCGCDQLSGVVGGGKAPDHVGSNGLPLRAVPWTSRILGLWIRDSKRIRALWTFRIPGLWIQSSRKARVSSLLMPGRSMSQTDFVFQEALGRSMR